MTNSNLSIIIVTFNSEKYIHKCIRSIKESELEDLKTNIVIIDNSSNDKTVDIVKKYIKLNSNISLIKNINNVGFARAVNQGIKENFQSEYFLLLNPDTILEKKSIFNLIKCAKVNQSGICGGETIDTYGNISGSCFRFPNLMVGIFDFTNFRKLTKNDYWHKYFYYLDAKPIKKDCFSVDVVTGGYMLIKKNTIEKIGLLDESFFMYLEDVDYCLRAKNVGIKIYHSMESKILHVGGASSNNKDKVRHSSWLRSRKLYFIKHFGLLENAIIQPIFLIDDFFIMTKLKLGI
jgi:GT2 family glycosyltransferase